MSDVGTIIAAGANLVGNVMTNQINAERAASDMIQYYNLLMKQRQWQKEDYDWTEGYSKRMLDYQNEYNSPSEQMQRYREAGLNPFLMMQSGQVGSGNSQSVPNAPLPSRNGVTPFQRPSLGNPMEGVADKLYGASQLKSQRIVALSEMAKSIPSLVKGVGAKAANSLLQTLFGRDSSSSTIGKLIDNEVLQSDYQTNISRIQSDIASEYGMEEAGNRVALQQQVFAKITGEMNLMQLESEHKQAEIHVLAAKYVESLASAWHLRKSGDYYEASANTINALRDLTKQALQFKVNSLRRQDITEQAWFEGERGLREHIVAEGDKLNDRFIQNWDIETDPFYNEVGKLLNAFHITTGLHYGYQGGYQSKDVNIYGY